MFDIANGPGTGGRMDQPIYSEKRRKELSEGINQNLHHIAKEIFGDKVNDPID